MMKMETKGALTNIVWFVGGMAFQIFELDGFAECFKTLTGDGDEAPTAADGDLAAGATATTSSLEEFFKNLLTVIEFLCYIKDKLIGYFTAENRRLKNLKRHRKMNFVEKRRTMTEAMRKKSWGDIVSWVKEKVGQVKTAAVALGDKLKTWATAAWETIKLKYAEFKAWVKTTWEKTKAWFAKVAGYIEKFNKAKACTDVAKTMKKPLEELWGKIKEWVKGIVDRTADIVSAVGGNVVAMAKIAAGIICAIPHVVKMVQIYKDKTITNNWYKWGQIIAQAGSAFAA